jgi:16S rRNA (guanine966-N2)-methyltransferase
MSRVKPQQVRIIGGIWRGRKIPVANIDGLRPTPDRIRETLFNWLVMDCPGASVLDCFAGSGVLGFEAISRAAKQLTMVEKDQQAWDRLRQQLERFECDAITLMCGDIVKLIPEMKKQFDLVFVDPPYALPQLRYQVINSLLEHQRLIDGAKIFIEWPAAEQFDLPVPELSWLKQKKAGLVNYGIAEWRLRSGYKGAY